MVALVVLVAGGAAVMVLAVWAGTRMLTSGGSQAGEGGVAVGALGNFIDIFDPARARADRDLASTNEARVPAPSPDGDDPTRMRVDLRAGVVRIPPRS